MSGPWIVAPLEDPWGDLQQTMFSRDKYPNARELMGYGITLLAAALSVLGLEVKKKALQVERNVTQLNGAAEALDRQIQHQKERILQHGPHIYG